jgi:hypothetical protein
MRHHDWFSDTDPRALKVFLELQRKMTPAEKVAAVFELSDLLMRLSETGVREQYPGADEREVFLRAAARRYDRETMMKVYGWDPAGVNP